ncbi:hypothetical protein JCM16418A_40160 [Paenibacillus pini]
MSKILVKVKFTAVKRKHIHNKGINEEKLSDTSFGTLFGSLTEMLSFNNHLISLGTINPTIIAKKIPFELL